MGPMIPNVMKYNLHYGSCNNLKYWDRQAWANSADLDQMPQNPASDQGLHLFAIGPAIVKHINIWWNRLLQIIGQVW